MLRRLPVTPTLPLVDRTPLSGSRRAAPPQRLGTATGSAVDAFGSVPPARNVAARALPAAPGTHSVPPPTARAALEAALAAPPQGLRDRLRAWLLSPGVPLWRLAAAVSAQPSDVQYMVVHALDGNFPRERAEGLLLALLEAGLAPWVRGLAAFVAYQLGYHPPRDPLLRRLIVEDAQAEVRAADLEYQLPLRADLPSWLEDPSPFVRMRAAQMLAGHEEMHPQLAGRLQREPTLWVVHMGLRALCRQHGATAWRIWNVLTPASRTAPTLAMLQRYAGDCAPRYIVDAGDTSAVQEAIRLSSSGPTVTDVSLVAGVSPVSPVIEAAMDLLANSLDGYDFERIDAVAQAGEVVAALAALGDDESLALAAAVTDRCVSTHGYEHLEAALVALRSRPEAFVRVALPMIRHSNYKVLDVLARVLPGLAAEPEAYAGMRLLVSLRDVACTGLPAFARARPELRDDVVARLLQCSAGIHVEPGIAACRALWELSATFPEVASQAGSATRRLARDGSTTARAEALALLGEVDWAENEADNEAALKAACQSTVEYVREAAERARAHQLVRAWGADPLGQVVQRVQHLASVGDGTPQQSLILALALVERLQRESGGDPEAALEASRVLDRLTWPDPALAEALESIRRAAMPTLLVAAPGEVRLLHRLTDWAGALTRIDRPSLEALAACGAPGSETVLQAMRDNVRISGQTHHVLES